MNALLKQDRFAQHLDVQDSSIIHILSPTVRADLAIAREFSASWGVRLTPAILAMHAMNSWMTGI